MTFKDWAWSSLPYSLFFFFNDTATTEIYTLSLHDALPIYLIWAEALIRGPANDRATAATLINYTRVGPDRLGNPRDRKSTRPNSSHSQISYAVFCLKQINLSGARLSYSVLVISALRTQLAT